MMKTNDGEKDGDSKVRGEMLCEFQARVRHGTHMSTAVL
jgi:hypothetical protein